MKIGESFDVKTRTIKTPPRYPKNRTTWFPCKTQSLPNLSKIDHKLLDQDLENAVKNATRDLRYQTLYLLQQLASWTFTILLDKIPLKKIPSSSKNDQQKFLENLRKRLYDHMAPKIFVNTNKKK